MAKQVRSEDTVDRVLRAAAVVFAKHGIRGGSIHTIARRSRVSIGSIYHHFGDRDGVARALFSRQLEGLLSHVGPAFVGAGNARQALDALVDAYLDWVQQNMQAARFLFFAGPAELQANEAAPLDAAKAAYMAPMIARVQAFVRAGVLRDMPLPVFEVIVVAPVAELARRYVAGANALLAPACVNALKEALWRSVAVDPSADAVTR